MQIASKRFAITRSQFVSVKKVCLCPNRATRSSSQKGCETASSEPIQLSNNSIGQASYVCVTTSSRIHDRLATSGWYRNTTRTLVDGGSTSTKSSNVHGDEPSNFLVCRNAEQATKNLCFLLVDHKHFSKLHKPFRARRIYRCQKLAWVYQERNLICYCFLAMPQHRTNCRRCDNRHLDIVKFADAQRFRFTCRGCIFLMGVNISAFRVEPACTGRVLAFQGISGVTDSDSCWSA